MSDLVHQQQEAVAKAGDTSSPERDHHHHPHGNPHLAHHFDTPEQQFNSAKIGMWVFLATELLMFGGLFCAYSVYRHNHPEVFEFAHHYLNRTLGAVNTVFLITSSLTMAWGVRAAQLGQRRVLIGCLIATLLGGAAFMVIKTIEYEHKYHQHVWFGAGNQFSKLWQGSAPAAGHGGDDHGGAGAGAGTASGAAAAHALGTGGTGAAPQATPTALDGPTSGGHGASERPGVLTQTERSHAAETHEQAAATQPTALAGDPWVDPNAGTGDAARIMPTQIIPVGIVDHRETPAKHEVKFEDLPQLEKERVATFFNIYFLMTGLHGVHVVIGMALIFWVLLRSISPHRRPLWLGFVPVALGAYLLWLGTLTHGHLAIPGWRTFNTGVWWLAALVLLVGVAMIARGVARARALPRRRGDFGPLYYTPVDLVGLYWHLVDLIWIFLFPLLYLIH